MTQEIKHTTPVDATAAQDGHGSALDIKTRRPKLVVWMSFAAFAAFIAGSASFLAADRISVGNQSARLAKTALPAALDEGADLITPEQEQGSTDNADAPVSFDEDPAEVASLEQESVPVTATPEVVTEEEPVVTPRLMNVKVKPGATLMSTLMKAGLPRSEAYEVVQGLTKIFDPRRLRAGQIIELTFIPDEDGEETLSSVAMKIDAVTNIVAVRTTDDRFSADEVITELTVKEASAIGTIDSSLYVSARDAGLPDAVILELINIYSFDVDFQWEVRQGDSFRVVYDQYQDSDGNIIKNGAIRFAELTLSGDNRPLFQYTDSKGEEGYYNEKGFSARKALLRMPVSGARLSSGFGKRRHPILGYSKMHKGADYAAPKGTPIKAAGAGVIVSSGWNGGYGKYIRIRHNDTFQTAYAHMNSIRKGMSKGKRVKQGQIIGYVGTTGRSTGPHLHYEVLKRGKQVNPLKVKMPTGRKLKGSELARFKTEMGKTKDRMAALFTPSNTEQAAKTVRNQRASQANKN